MSTRAEILAALTEAPDGLTSKELAPLCPACECDPLIVGRVIATLRSENEIHPGTEFREGATIWMLGAEKVEDPVEHVTVPLQSSVPAGRPRHISPAAQAIADMRRPEPTTARRAPDRAHPPVTTPAPARAVDLNEGNDMEKREQVLKAIQDAGEDGVPVAPLAKIAGSKYLARKVVDELIGEKLVKRHGTGRGLKYVSSIKDARPQPRTPPKRVNGNGHGSIYAEALNGLQEKRAVLADELAKVDRAIEAVGALA